MKPFKVLVTHTNLREFRVEAHTSEEAEDIALRYYEDGEPGKVLDSGLESIEAFLDDEGEIC